MMLLTHGLTRWRPAAWLVPIVLASAVSTAGAGQWNDRTKLEFSEPVTVPGATLQPGTYVFQLSDGESSRHLVEIRRADGEVVALTQAVPMKRTEPKGDIVLTFRATEPGTPPAVAGWFYPGSLYGHRFVYSDDEAKDIARRTKSLVLSSDVAGSDLEQGTLKVYDARGVATAWQPDADAAASWTAWQRDRRASAGAVVPKPRGEEGDATAPMMRATLTGTPLPLDELESDAARYVGQTVQVEGEVEEVYGPRVFSIDERNWADLEGELLVYVPTSLAAVVREDDQVTISGTLKRFVKSDFEKEWGWQDLDDQQAVKLGERPVLVATQVVGGNDESAMVVKVEERRTRNEVPVGTSGTAAPMIAPALTDLKTVVTATDDEIGRRVRLDDVRIQALANDHGFIATHGDHTVFVLPSDLQTVFRPGETVSLQGVVLDMPRHMAERVTDPAGAARLNDRVYVYAFEVTR